MKFRARHLLLLALILGLFQSTSARAWDPLQKARRAAEKAGEKLRQGDSKAAIENYARAQAYRPQDPDYRMGMGEALYADGDLKGAMSQFLAASSAADPEQTQQALYNAGNVALAKKDPAQALSLYQKALLAGKPSPDLLHNLELAQRLLEKQKKQQQKSDQKQSKDQKQNKDEKGDQNQDQKRQQSKDSKSEQQRDSQKSQKQQEQKENPQQNEQGKQDEQSKEQDQKRQEQQSAAQDSTMQQPARPDSTQAALSDSMASKVGVMTPAEALRLLNALDHDEEELRRSIQRRLRKTENKSKHDW